MSRYGAGHRAVRRAGLAAAWGRACARCGRPMRPGEPVDLDHRDDGVGYLGFSHRSCNRAAGAVKTNRARAEALRRVNGKKGWGMVATETAVGVEISDDRSRTSVVTASLTDREEVVVVELAAYLDGTVTAAATVAALAATEGVVAVVIDPHSQAATLARPLAAAGVAGLVELSTAEVVVAHGTFLDELAAGRVRHVPHPALDAAARAGVTRRLGGAQTWDRRAGTVDTSPLTAATLAVWGALFAPRPKGLGAHGGIW